MDLEAGMKVLVLNAGSSSVKYQIFYMGNFLMIAHGILEQIGRPESRLRHKWLQEENSYGETVEERMWFGKAM